MKPERYTVERPATLSAKRMFLDLLLLADPSEEMVGRYLTEGELFVWRDDAGKIAGEAVVDATGEVRNLAVVPMRQGQGWGRRMLDDLCEYYKGTFPALTVGTSNGGVTFYEKCGFRYSHAVRGFFTDNYPEPVFEKDGTPCVDMVVLVREL